MGFIILKNVYLFQKFQIGFIYLFKKFEAVEIP